MQNEQIYSMPRIGDTAPDFEAINFQPIQRQTRKNKFKSEQNKIKTSNW